MGWGGFLGCFFVGLGFGVGGIEGGLKVGFWVKWVQGWILFFWWGSKLGSRWALGLGGVLGGFGVGL